MEVVVCGTGIGGTRQKTDSPQRKPQEQQMTILQLIDMLGVSVFAVSGALAAGRKSLDLLGVVVIATVTAVGGGTTRDLLLDRNPVFWIDDPIYLVVAAAAALLTVAYTRWRHAPAKALAIADAIGLGFFVIAGAQIAERLYLPGIIVVVMGVVTGVAGGVVRDVLTAEIPMILRRGELYATTAIIGVSIYLLLAAVGIPSPIPAIAGVLTIVVLRLAAIFWSLRLPVFTLPEP
jgi:uncharacterized membrane protein YeiH